VTLSTDVYVLDEIDPLGVFRFCQGLLAKYDGRSGGPHPQSHNDTQDKSWDGEPGEFSAKPTDPWTIANKVGQGLPAWLMLHYRPAASLRTAEEAAEHDEDCNIPGNDDYDPDRSDCDGSGYAHRTACWLSVDFDTAYGYKDKRGMGCGDLHAALVAEFGEWLTARRVRWLWRNEFTGEVHEGPERLVELCSGGFEAQSWFTQTVLPAITGMRA